MRRVINFGAGPAALPLSVLERFSSDLIDFEGLGVGVGELSHRQEAFESSILARATESLLSLAEFRPDEWQVLWMTGGGFGQFSAIPLNLAGRKSGGLVVYLITGIWSEKAAGEAARLIGANRTISIDLRGWDGEGRRCLRDPEEWINELESKLFNSSTNSDNNSDNSDNVSYYYYCDNETVDGLELPSSNYFQDLLLLLELSSPPIFVVDSSSNFMSRPLADPAGRTALIFAGVQKNLGAAGVTAVLIKRKLLRELEQIDDHDSKCPLVLDYKVMAKHNSLLNTPPVMAIHMCNLVLQDLRDRFPQGLPSIDAFSREKSQMIYEAISESPRGFDCPVAPKFRSRMNVVFRGPSHNEEEQFLREAEGEGLIQLRGHRSVGGMRASLYNAITIENVHQLKNLIMKKPE